MDTSNLTPATRETLDALTALGEGNTHEISAHSGRSRSATDRALKQLADAGLITVVDTGADPAEGTPTRYTPVTTADSPTTAEDTADAQTAEEQGTDPDSAEAADNNTPEGDETNDADGEETDHDGDDEGEDDRDDDEEDDDDDEEEEDDDEGGDQDDDSDGEESKDGNAAPASPAAPAMPTRIPDRVVLLLAGILNAFPTGIDAATIVQISGKHPVTVKKILTAMEQAGAAIRTKPNPDQGQGKELWLLGETNPADVDPSPEPPRCPTCQQVIRQGQNGTTRSTGTATPRQPGTTTNSDGSTKFGPGELRALVKTFINANPGQDLTVGTIQRDLQVQLGRTISPGAVRNNCASLAANGECQLVTDEPYTVTANPVPATTDASTPGGETETDSDE